jgi:SAM-dependent methyltransferase
VNRTDVAQQAPAGTAKAVYEFYERVAYPPPLTSLDEHRELYANPERRRAQFHLHWPTEPLRSEREILVAGCGTSQAARYALQEPEAHVTGVDSSSVSLRHTRELQRKYGLDNLQLHQLPVERVAELGGTFDQIVCTGVLHHLPDPDQGLRALRDVLKPGGALHLMVYAPYGRTGIYMMQQYCRLLNIEPSDTDLRDLGATLGVLSTDHPLASVLRRALDFRNPDALADALLHPLDRAYTVPELYAWLERCGMRFGRWFEQAPYLPYCGMVAKTAHAARLAALPAPEQHAAVELLRGTMVRHNLIAYRDDYPGAHEPIVFAGDDWQGYVPIRVPWTVCVRERVPPGSVAVLINRAHPFTDLILPIGAAEDRMLGAIDGKRTIREIGQAAMKGGADPEHCVRDFFERLWRYDQVVFEASRGAGAPGPGSQDRACE